jgi:hypothetical protein
MIKNAYFPRKMIISIDCFEKRLHLLPLRGEHGFHAQLAWHRANLPLPIWQAQGKRTRNE